MSKAAKDNTLSPIDPTLGPLGQGESVPAPGDASAAGVVESLSIAPTRRPRISGTWVLLIGSAFISTGVLMGMRYIGMKGGVTGKEVKFDESLVQAAARPKRDYGAVIRDLNASRVTQQVPGEQVKKNPFRLAETMEGLMPVTETVDPSLMSRAAELEALRKKEQERAAAVTTELRGFKLQTVLGGRPPLARVSGNLVRVGDTLGKFFKVKAIHGRTVDLECDGRVYEIGISPTDIATGEK
ncbi:MAG: hypothetical protein AB7K52_13020 [Phycisphaerales bacterium]